MENYDRFEQLLREYSFKELNSEDELVAKQFVGSEEEYEYLRQTSLQLHDHFKTKINPPSAAIWKRVKNSRMESAQGSNYGWIKKPVPTYAMAALLLISVGSLGWYGGFKYRSSMITGAQEKTRLDTIFVASKPDTVIKEKIIYVDRPFTPAMVVQTSAQPSESASTKGVSMKETEELEKFLVSGSI